MKNQMYLLDNSAALKKLRSDSGLFVFAKGETCWGLTVATVSARANTDDVGVDGTRDAVMILDIGLGDRILLVHRGLGKIAES